MAAIRTERMVGISGNVYCAVSVFCGCRGLLPSPTAPFGNCSIIVPMGNIAEYSIAQKLNPCLSGDCEHHDKARAAVTDFLLTDSSENDNENAVLSRMTDYLTKHGVPKRCRYWAAGMMTSISKDPLHYTVGPQERDAFRKWQDNSSL